MKTKGSYNENGIYSTKEKYKEQKSTKCIILHNVLNLAKLLMLKPSWNYNFVLTN